MLQAKYLLLGDTHGQLDAAIRAIAAAKAARVDTIIQLGDWGFLWPKHNAILALHQLLDDAAVRMIFIDGNHDWHGGLATVAWHQYPWLRYMPRGTVETFGDVRVGFLGGAASIDRDHRTPGRNWWPTETITDAEVDRLTTCDVLLTHDAPAVPRGLPAWPWPVSLAVTAALDHNREMIQRAIERAQPRRVFHGHYHFAYRDFAYPSRDRLIVGLDADGRKGSMLLVDKRFDPC